MNDFIYILVVWWLFSKKKKKSREKTILKIIIRNNNNNNNLWFISFDPSILFLSIHLISSHSFDFEYVGAVIAAYDDTKNYIESHCTIQMNESEMKQISFFFFFKEL